MSPHSATHTLLGELGSVTLFQPTLTNISVVMRVCLVNILFGQRQYVWKCLHSQYSTNIHELLENSWKVHDVCPAVNFSLESRNWPKFITSQFISQFVLIPRGIG